MAGQAVLAERKDERSLFLAWLQEQCVAGDLTAGRLQRLLVRHGWDCTAETTRRWLRGDRVPPADVVPYLLNALTEVLPKEDLHASFRRFAQMSYSKGNPQAAA